MHDAEFVRSEYVFAAHDRHAWSAVTVQVPLLDVPGWHTLQGVQALAPAADHELPAAQLVQFGLAVAVQAEAR